MEASFPLQTDLQEPLVSSGLAVALQLDSSDQRCLCSSVDRLQTQPLCLTHLKSPFGIFEIKKLLNLFKYRKTWDNSGSLALEKTENKYTAKLAFSTNYSYQSTSVTRDFSHIKKHDGKITRHFG